MKNNSQKIPPVFIVGAPRSGTTLLRLMLTSHPGVSIPPEGAFMINLAPKYGDLKDLLPVIDQVLDELYSNKKFLDWGIKKEVLKEEARLRKKLNFSEFIELVYRLYAKLSHPTASIWGDKNPTYFQHTETIHQYFPEARIVHITRDVRGVYHSRKSLIDKWKLNPDTLMLAVTNEWHALSDLIARSASDSRFFTLKYENLVAEPEKQLISLCRWLGIAYDSRMIRYYEENQDKSLVPKDKLAWHANTMKATDESVAWAWREKLSGMEISALEYLNYEQLKSLGYEVTEDNKWLGRAYVLKDKFKLRLKKLKLI